MANVVLTILQSEALREELLTGPFAASGYRRNPDMPLIMAELESAPSITKSVKMKPESYFYSPMFNKWWADKKINRDSIDLSVRYPVIPSLSVVAGPDGAKLRYRATAPGHDRQQVLWDNYHGAGHRPPLTCILKGAPKAYRRDDIPAGFTDEGAKFKVWKMESAYFANMEAKKGD